MGEMFLAGALIIGSPALKAKPVEPPAGEWVVEWHISNGKAMGLSQGKKCRFTTTARRWAPGDYFLMSMIGDDRAGFFDDGGALKVDFGAGADRKRGIWKVDGDTLFMCESRPGGPAADRLHRPARVAPLALGVQARQ